MPRSDSSGSSRNRRGSSRTTSSRKSFDDKGSSSGPRGKKTSRSKPDGPSGFKKSGSEKPAFRKSESSKPFSNKRSSSADSRGGKFSRSKSDEERPSRFKKYDSEKPSFGRKSDSPKPFSSKRPSSDSRGGKFGRSKPDGEERSSRFKKPGFDKPSFGRGDSSKPFRKSTSFDPDKKFSRNKPDGDERSSRFKKPGFDKPSFGKGDNPKPFRKSTSFDPTAKKFSRNKPDDTRSSDSKKFSSEKPSFRRDENSSDDKRSFSGSKEKKPFTKRFDDKDKDDRVAPSSYTDKPSFKRKENRESDTRGFSEKRIEKSRIHSKGTESSETPVQSEKIRLNKFIANSGVCSRREADELITMGLISVNGKTITELGYKVNPGDEVRHESKVLRSEKLVYVLMNKPKGYLTTTNDPQERNTVMHIIGNSIKERIYPVGRLDRNTTGLLLLTNDGDLADKLMHPSYNAKKIYKAELDRPFAKGDLEKIMEGVQLEEGKAIVDDVAIISDDRKTVGLEIHIGWNRVVRRIFEALEYQVVKLDRSVYAGLDKKDLPRGHWRPLSKEEIIRLKHYNKPGRG